MIIENIVCMIVGILIGYTGMYVAGYKPTRIEELVRNYNCKRRIRSPHEEHHQTKHALWMARALRAEGMLRFFALALNMEQCKKNGNGWNASASKRRRSTCNG